MYAASGDGHLQALDANTGKTVWEFGTNVWIGLSRVAGGVAYAESGDHRLRAFAAKTGKMLWDFVAGGTIDAMVAVDGVAYVTSQDGHLRALTNTGPAGPDYAQRAGTRLAAVLTAQERAAEAWRLAARLGRERPRARRPIPTSRRCGSPCSGHSGGGEARGRLAGLALGLSQPHPARPMGARPGLPIRAHASQGRRRMSGRQGAHVRLRGESWRAAVGVQRRAPVLPQRPRPVSRGRGRVYGVPGQEPEGPRRQDREIALEPHLRPATPTTTMPPPWSRTVSCTRNRWDDHLRAADARTGTLLWDFKAGNRISPPVVADGMGLCRVGRPPPACLRRHEREAALGIRSRRANHHPGGGGRRGIRRRGKVLGGRVA